MTEPKDLKPKLRKIVTEFDPMEPFKPHEEDGKLFPNYNPPEIFEFSKRYLVTTYEKHKGLNGQNVEIEEVRIPERYFIITALADVTNEGIVIEGFKLVAGAMDGIHISVSVMADLIARGQLQKVWGDFGIEKGDR